MSAAEVDPHGRAVFDQLTADLEAPVGYAQAPPGAPGVAVYPWGIPGHERLHGKHEHFRGAVFVHSIGEGPEQAIWVADRVAASLLGTEPVVAGRHVYPLVLAGATVPQRDDSLDPPLFVVTQTFEMESDPA